MDKNEILVMEQEEMSDDLYEDFYAFLKDFDGEFGVVDKSDRQAINALLDKVLSQFSQGKNMSEGDMNSLREAMEHKYVIYASDEKDSVSEEVKKNETEKEGKEEQKKRLESEINPEEFRNAANRYAGWVLPYEQSSAGEFFDESLFAESLEKFRKRQVKYLVEEEGIDHRDISDAIEVVMQKVSDIIEKMTEKQKEKQWEIAKKRVQADQKDILIKNAKKISNKWKKIDFGQDELVKNLWNEMERGIREDAQKVNDQGQERSLLSVNVEEMVNIARNNFEKNAAKKREEIAKKPVNIGVLKEKMIQKLNVLSQKREALKNSQDAIRRAGIERDFKREREDTLSVFEDEYNKAHKEYMDAIAERESERKKEVVVACEKMDVQTKVSAEKRGFGHIFEKAKIWVKNMGGRARRTATAAFVTVGLVMTFSGTVNNDHGVDVADAHVQNDGQTKIEYVSQILPGERSANIGLSENLAHDDFSMNSLGRELPVIDKSSADEFAQGEGEVDERNSEKVVVAVKKGDTLWGIIANQLKGYEGFENLNDKQKIIAIDTLKDRFAKMTSDQLMERGFKSGDVDKIYEGNSLDLTEILSDSTIIDNFIKKEYFD